MEGIKECLQGAVTYGWGVLLNAVAAGFWNTYQIVTNFQDDYTNH